MLISSGLVSCQPFFLKSETVGSSLIVVAKSNSSPERAGASMNFKNSSDLLHKYLSPRHSMSLRPLVFQFAIVVNGRCGGESVFQKSVTTGWRVGSHLKLYVGTGNSALPTFSPNVNRAWCLFK